MYVGVLMIYALSYSGLSYMPRRKFYNSDTSFLRLPVFTQRYFKKLLHAEVPGLIALQPTPASQLLSDNALLNMPAMAGVLPGFQPNRQPNTAANKRGRGGGGFGARRILVGDLMNWGSVIPGTGTFHAKLTQLEKKLQLRRPVESLGQGMNRVVKLAAKRLRDDPAVPALTQAEKLGV